MCASELSAWMCECTRSPDGRSGQRQRSIARAHSALVHAVRFLADRCPEFDAHVLVNLDGDARPILEPPSRWMNPKTLACFRVEVPGTASPQRSSPPKKKGGGPPPTQNNTRARRA